MSHLGDIPKTKATLEYPRTWATTTAQLLFCISHDSGQNTSGFPRFPIPLLKHIHVSLNNTLTPHSLYPFLPCPSNACEAAEYSCKTSNNWRGEWIESWLRYSCARRCSWRHFCLWIEAFDRAGIRQPTEILQKTEQITTLGVLSEAGILQSIIAYENLGRYLDGLKTQGRGRGVIQICWC